MPSYRVTDRAGCRICGDQGCRCFLDLGKQPMTDGFVSADQIGSEFLWPLRLYWCPKCHTAQTLHDVAVEQYYLDYRYTVSSSGFARQFMKVLAENACRRFAIGREELIVEIGSGDGFQLKCFQNLGMKVQGFEPSSALAKASREIGVPVMQGLFSHEMAGDIPGRARVILLTYTFDHLSDPLPFLDAIKTAIDPRKGVLIIEVHDLAKIMPRRETCLFAHEHSIYLTTLSMKRLLARAGWLLVAADLVEESQRRGNSLLVAAAPDGSDWPEAPLAEEPFAAYDNWDTYASFSESVARAYQLLRDYVRAARSRGQRVAGYGAGGRGVMTIAMAGLTADDIAYVCDQNASFHGLYMPLSHVLVVGPERLLSDGVDEVIVFSFGYFAEIQQQLAEFRRRGGKLVSLLDILAR